MAQIKISELTTGTPKGTDEIPGVDTTDTTQAPSGTTKKYIQSDILNFYLHAQGLTTYSATRVATTVALTVTYANGASGVGATLTNAGAQAALAIDGVTLAVADRVLVKNQASTFQNGIYTVTNVGSGSTNWVMTRATDYDQAAEVIQYGVVLSDQGTTNAGLLWQETAAGPFVIGTSPITFVQYVAGSGSSVNPGLINQLAWYASTGSTVSGLATLANGVLITNNSSVPSLLANSGTPGYVLTANSGAPPSWQASSLSGAVLLNPSGDQVISAHNLRLAAGQIASGDAAGGYIGNFVGYSTTAAKGYIQLFCSDNVGNYGNTLTNTSTTAARAWVLPDASGTIALVASSAQTFNGDSGSATPSSGVITFTGGTTGLTFAAAASTLTLGGTLVPANGGLGTGTAPSAGQIPIGTSGNVYTPAAIASGTGILVSNGSGSITISATGTGMTWTTSSSTTVAADVDNGYVSGNAAASTFTLPATAAVGSVVAVEGLGAGGWVLAANTGQTIKIGPSTTSSAGSLTSAAASDNVYVRCIVANTTWRVITTNSTGLAVA